MNRLRSFRRGLARHPPHTSGPAGRLWSQLFSRNGWRPRTKGNIRRREPDTGTTRAEIALRAGTGCVDLTRLCLDRASEKKKIVRKIAIRNGVWGLRTSTERVADSRFDLRKQRGNASRDRPVGRKAAARTDFDVRADNKTVMDVAILSILFF